MRSLTVFSLVLLLNVSLCFELKSVVGLYCPETKNWSWEAYVDMIPTKGIMIYLMPMEGKARDHLQVVRFLHPSNYRTSNLENAALHSNYVHNCTKDGSIVKFRDAGQLAPKLNKDVPVYDFYAVNLNENSHTIAYEKLFIKYLEEECPTGDCSSIRERISMGCSNYRSRIKDCNDGFEKAFAFCMENKDSNNKICVPSAKTKSSITTTTEEAEESKTTTFIIIGVVVGIVVFIVACGFCFFCLKKKK